MSPSNKKRMRLTQRKTPPAGVIRNGPVLRMV